MRSKVFQVGVAVVAVAALVLALTAVIAPGREVLGPAGSVSGYLFSVEDGEGTVQFSIADGGGVDIQGNVLDLDADADTSITADTDDEIDVEIGGQDVASMTASDATFLVDVYQQMPVLAKTASYTMTQAESGALVSNGGASAEITLTLPSAVPGLRYCLYVAEAYTITVELDDADQIHHLTDAAGDRLQNAGTAGDSVCLSAIDTTEWAPTGEVGTWSDVD
jgi:hypothetical protein